MPEGSKNSFSVPLFGEAVEVTLERSEQDYVLTVQGTTSESEFRWICAKIYEQRACYSKILDLSTLRAAVRQHFQTLDPDPGFDAASYSFNDRSNKEHFHELISPAVLRELQDRGFVTIATNCQTTQASNRLLSQNLVNRSSQDVAIRTDFVQFLTREEAATCEIQSQFDLLMSIASQLNGGLELAPSKLEPRKPGTKATPLTNPLEIQAAQYGKGDYYIAHR